MARRIYLASSWRNELQPEYVQLLRKWGHQVYDFRNPPNGPGGFHWSELDENWSLWSPSQYRDHLLNDARAAQGFTQDLRGMAWSDTCVLLMPCGKSAHLELGLCAGQGKHTVVHIPNYEFEPELMYLLADDITSDQDKLRETLQ